MSNNKQRLIPFALLLIGVWAYWSPLQSIVENWSSNADYSHGFIVPFICAAILYLRRESLPEMAPTVSFAGLALMLFACLMRYSSGRLYFPELDAWSLPVWIGGWVWMCFGWRCFRWAAPAIGFLCFAMPLPATIEIALSTPLQKLAAGCSAWTLRLFSQPAIVDGTVILLDGHQFEVERACSGLRMFFGILALAVATITLARTSLWKSLLLLAAVIPVSIIANVIRIDVTALLAKYWSGEVSERFSHDFAAVAMVPLAAAMFWGVLVLLDATSRRFAASKSSGSSWVLRLGVAAVVLIVSVLFMQRYFESRTLSTLQKTAERYEAEENYEKAATYYSRYLSIDPDDSGVAIQFAEMSHRSAHANGTWLRVAQLYLHAWELAPQQVELAVTAAQIATKFHEYRMALDIYEELRSNPHDASEISQSELEKLYADSLVAYLRWERGRANVTWQEAIDVLHQVMESGDYEVSHAATLASAIMDFSPQTETEGGPEEAGTPHVSACQVLEKLVKEKAEVPLAWLAKYEFERVYGSCSDAESEVSLQQALKLVSQSSGLEAARVYYVAAQLQMQKENSQAAQELLEKAIAAQPDFHLPHLARAKLFLAEGGAEGDSKAIAALENGLEQVLAKKGRTELSLLVPLASLLARTGQFEKAEALVVPLEKHAPNISESERGAVLGSIALVRGRIAAAEQSPRHALGVLSTFLRTSDMELAQNQFPKVYAEIWSFYGDLCFGMGQLDVAMDAYGRASDLNPSLAAARLQLANLATRSGNLELAEKQFMAVMGGTEEIQLNAAIGLAKVELQRQKSLPKQQRDWAAVTKALEKAAQHGAPHETIELVSVEMMIAQGQVDEAVARLENALEVNSDSALLWQDYAALKLQMGDYQTALQAAKKFRDLSDNRARATVLQSRVLVGDNQVEEAIALLQKELKVEQAATKQGELWIELSHLYLRNGDMPRAIEILESAHERLPQNKEIVDEAARLAWLRQEWNQLAKYAQWLQEIEGPQGTEWRAYQAQILLASLESANDPNFEKAHGLIQFVNDRRPNWPKSKILLGELSLLQGKYLAALSSYQEAWKLGSRNILLADRIIDMYTRTNSKLKAQEFVTQASKMLAFSPQLFDRAVPYYAQGTEREQALILAKSWAESRPDDVDTQLRLGRVLMMLAEGEVRDKKQKSAFLTEAENAFRKAVDNSPSNIRSWVAFVNFYDQVLDSREDAISTLQELAQQASISDRHKSFVLAQFYTRLGLVDEARRYYLESIILSSDAGDPRSLQILMHAAQFYFSQSPQLAEMLTRRVLVAKPNNRFAKLMLANLLLQDGEKAATEEAGRVLKQEFEDIEQNPQSAVIRARIRFLSRRGTPSDYTEAVGLAEGILDKKPDDLRTLADLYEHVDRISAAFEILDDLGNRVTPRPQDLTEYLRFWQQHFLAAPDQEETVAFEGSAKQIYAKLGETPEGLGEFVRWKIREFKVKTSEPQLSSNDTESLANEIRATSAFQAASTVEEQQALLTRMLSVAIHENEPHLAIYLGEHGFEKLSSEAAARSLIDALIINRDIKSSHNAVVDEFLARATATDVSATGDSLVQLLGDLRFLQGRYDDAVLLYRKVLERTPDSTMAQNNLALAIAETSSPIQEARAILQAALEHQPDSLQLNDSLATIELIAGNAQQVIDRLRPLANESLAGASLWLHLAEAYSQIGNDQSAQDAFQRALALGIERQVLSARDQTWLHDLSEHFRHALFVKGSS
ncbi:exosortase [Symmachiella dynata]|uniref:exosortase n=1 Tax=Symmachiella dynata TaxID=2527995 RepID=UPI0030EE6D55